MLEFANFESNCVLPTVQININTLKSCLRGALENSANAIESQVVRYMREK